jgi:hypothetical protein
MQLVSNKSNHSSSNSTTTTSPSNANHHLNNNNNNNNCSRDVENNNLNKNSNNNTLNGDKANFVSSSADNEIVLLQNAQLKTTVEEYKNIIAETVGFLFYKKINTKIDA